MSQTDNFKIFIDRLKKGEVEAIAFSQEPSFLGIEEKELKFHDPIQVSGEAYLVHNELVVKLSLKTKGELPCAICNRPTPFDIEVNNFYLTEPLEEIPSHIFDYSAEAREAILLEVPFVVECNEGVCPDRKDIAPYLASPSSDEGGWKPFKDL